MPINFHDANNKMTYTTRDSDQEWNQLIQQNVDLQNKSAVDVGCGGGIYTKTLVKLGVSHVVGIDFSDEMLKGALEKCKDLTNVTFSKGEAYCTNLPSSTYDVVLMRALIHHLDDLNRCYYEANRILKPNGILIVQDRTPENCLLPGSEYHLRGYFFEKFSKLIKNEVNRRYDSNEVKEALVKNDFKLEKEIILWEKRREYNHFSALSEDLLQRTGRSILHDLNDNELKDLVQFIQTKIGDKSPIIEKDCWTIWIAKKK